MSIRTIRAQLAADTDLGAGNVLATRINLADRIDEPRISFDTVVDGRPAFTAFSPRELDEAVRRRAAALHHLGVRPRDPIVIYASAAADHILGFLALTRLGAIPAGLNPNVDGEKAALYIKGLRATGVLADAAHLAILDGFDTGTPFLPDLTNLGSLTNSSGIRFNPDDAPPQYRYQPTDPVAITHSSGTTGMPKAVLHSHASLFASELHRFALPLEYGADRILNVLPAPHVATLIMLNRGLCADADMLFLSHQTGPGVLDAIENWHPHSVFGFAATWADLARYDLKQRDVDSVSLWWNTGDCAHEAHIRRLIAVGSRETATRNGRVRVPGSVFTDGFGSSEMGHAVFYNVHTQETQRYGRCVGRPYAFVDIAILGPDGEPLGAGEVGELATKTPTLCIGYWNDSTTTYRTRIGDYFLTGDLVYRDNDGYYYHLDRAVDSVDLGGGRRLYTALSEEQVLADCPDVLDCTVVAVRDGDRVVTDVLLQLASDADTTFDFTKAVSAALDEHVAATLRQVIVVDDNHIPVGPTGKVRKVLLRQRYHDELASAR